MLDPLHRQVQLTFMQLHPISSNDWPPPRHQPTLTRFSPPFLHPNFRQAPYPSPTFNDFRSQPSPFPLHTGRMDPLSLTTACITLLDAVGKTAIGITSFIRGCREARSDLTSISGELTQLHLVLELLKDDAAVSDGRVIPESLQNQILGIIRNCSAVLESINGVLKKHEGKSGAARWAAFGKGEVAGLRMLLEAHRGSLNLILELVSVSMSRAILDDVTVVRTDVHDIKLDTSQIPQIMAELTRLRAIVAGGEIPAATTGQNFVLEQYLDSLTSYAETVCGDVVWDSDVGSGAASRRSSHEEPRVEDQDGGLDTQGVSSGHAAAAETSGANAAPSPGNNASIAPADHTPQPEPASGEAGPSWVATPATVRRASWSKSSQKGPVSDGNTSSIKLMTRVRPARESAPDDEHRGPTRSPVQPSDVPVVQNVTEKTDKPVRESQPTTGYGSAMVYPSGSSRKSELPRKPVKTPNRSSESLASSNKPNRTATDTRIKLRNTAVHQSTLVPATTTTVPTRSNLPSSSSTPTAPEPEDSPTPNQNTNRPQKNTDKADSDSDSDSASSITATLEGTSGAQPDHCTLYPASNSGWTSPGEKYWAARADTQRPKRTITVAGDGAVGKSTLIACVPLQI